MCNISKRTERHFSLISTLQQRTWYRNTSFHHLLLLLPLAVQPTVSFGLSNNVLPFFFCVTNSLHLLTPSTWRSLSTSSFHLFDTEIGTTQTKNRIIQSSVTTSYVCFTPNSSKSRTGNSFGNKWIVEHARSLEGQVTRRGGVAKGWRGEDGWDVSNWSRHANIITGIYFGELCRRCDTSQSQYRPTPSARSSKMLADNTPRFPQFPI